MYDATQIQEAKNYLKDNNITGKASSTLALKNKFSINYDDLVSQLQGNTAAPTASVKAPSVPTAAPKATDSNLVKSNSTLTKTQAQIQEEEKKATGSYQKGVTQVSTSTPKPTAAPSVNTSSKYTKVESLQDWMDRGKKPTELVDYVEGKYGITAEYDSKTNKVFGYDVDGNKTKEWDFDKDGNPQRKDIKVMTQDSYMQGLQSLMDGGGSEKDIEKFLLDNKDLSLANREEVRAMYKTYLGNQDVLKNVSKLSSLDGKGLYAAYKNGDFVPGDATWNALSPEKQALYNTYKAQNIRQDIRTGKEVVAKIDSTESIDEVYNAMQVKNPEYQKKYEEIVLNNTERSTLRGELSEKYEAIKEKQSDYDEIERKMKEKYPSGSQSFIDQMIKKERGYLMEDIEDLVDQYDVIGQQYSFVDTDATNEYNAYVKDAELDYNVYQSAMQQYLINVQNSEAEADEQFLKDNQKFAILKTEEAYAKYADFNNKVVSGEIEGEYISNDSGLFFQEKDGTSHQIVSGELFSETSAGEYQIKEWQNDDGTITASIFNPVDGTYDIQTKDINGSIVYGGSTGGSSSGGTTFSGDAFGSDGGVDLTYLRSQYPNEAWAGTNNPTGITWGAASAGLKEAWAEQGITFKKGSARPGEEGGNYVEFDSIQDGLAAYAVALHRKESSVRDGLASWVGYCKDDACLASRPTYTKANAYNYADSIISESGVSGTTKFNDLSMEQLYQVQKSQLKRESPGLYAVLKKNDWLGENRFAIPTQSETSTKDSPSGASALLGATLDPKATESEQKSYLYGTRMADSQHNLIDLEAQFMEKGIAERYWETYAPNAAKSEEQQLFETNGKEFVAALLRKDTGAAVTPDEWAYYNNIYFPQPGDKDSTIQLKQHKREIALKTMLGSAGGDINGVSLASYYTSPSFVTSSGDINLSTQTQDLIMENIVNDVMNGSNSGGGGSGQFPVNPYTGQIDLNSYANPELEAVLAELSAKNRNESENIFDTAPTYGDDGYGNPTYGPGSLPGQQ